MEEDIVEEVEMEIENSSAEEIETKWISLVLPQKGIINYHYYIEGRTENLCTTPLNVLLQILFQHTVVIMRKRSCEEIN